MHQSPLKPTVEGGFDSLASWLAAQALLNRNQSQMSWPKLVAKGWQPLLLLKALLIQASNPSSTLASSYST